MNSPSRKVGLAHTACTSAAVRGTSCSPHPSASSVRTTASQSFGSRRNALTRRYPAGTTQASTPLASHQAPMPPTASSASRASVSAASRPYRRISSGTFSHQPWTKPPLRPLGPPPQMSCSRMVIRVPGARSRRNQAVHMPV